MRDNFTPPSTGDIGKTLDEPKDGPKDKPGDETKDGPKDGPKTACGAGASYTCGADQCCHKKSATCLTQAPDDMCGKKYEVCVTGDDCDSGLSCNIDDADTDYWGKCEESIYN